VTAALVDGSAVRPSKKVVLDVDGRFFVESPPAG
jgi:hypothetical protein